MDTNYIPHIINGNRVATISKEKNKPDLLQCIKTIADIS